MHQVREDTSLPWRLCYSVWKDKNQFRYHERCTRKCLKTIEVGNDVTHSCRCFVCNKAQLLKITNAPHSFLCLYAKKKIIVDYQVKFHERPYAMKRWRRQNDFVLTDPHWPKHWVSPGILVSKITYYDEYMDVRDLGNTRPINCQSFFTSLVC